MSASNATNTSFPIPGIGFYFRWVLMTTLGLGTFALVVIAQDIIITLPGIIRAAASFILGMAFIGMLQYWVIRRYIHHASRWILTTIGDASAAIVILLMAFNVPGGRQTFEQPLYEMTSKVMGFQAMPQFVFPAEGHYLDPPRGIVEEISQAWQAALTIERALLGMFMGVCIGILQYFVHWRRVRLAQWWIAASVVSWGLCMATYQIVSHAVYVAMLTQSLAWAKGEIVGRTLSGTALGLLSGIGLIWLLRLSSRTIPTQAIQNAA